MKKKRNNNSAVWRDGCFPCPILPGYMRANSGGHPYVPITLQPPRKDREWISLLLVLPSKIICETFLSFLQVVFTADWSRGLVGRENKTHSVFPYITQGCPGTDPRA